MVGTNLRFTTNQDKESERLSTEHRKIYSIAKHHVPSAKVPLRNVAFCIQYLVYARNKLNT